MWLWLRISSKTVVFRCDGTDVVVTSDLLLLRVCCDCGFVLFQKSCGVFSS
ncbi:unnamed protein product [Brassica rapa subsp. narinosa]